MAANASLGTGVYIYDTYGFGGWVKFGGTSEAMPATGANGKCSAKVRYLGQGEKGYDGPTGAGAPSGIRGLASQGAARRGGTGNIGRWNLDAASRFAEFIQ